MRASAASFGARANDNGVRRDARASYVAGMRELIRAFAVIVIVFGIITFFQYEPPRDERDHSHGMGMGFGGNGGLVPDVSREIGTAMILVGGFGVGMTLLRRIER